MSRSFEALLDEMFIKASETVAELVDQKLHQMHSRTVDGFPIPPKPDGKNWELAYTPGRGFAWRMAEFKAGASTGQPSSPGKAPGSSAARPDEAGVEAAGTSEADTGVEGRAYEAAYGLSSRAGALLSPDAPSTATSNKTGSEAGGVGSGYRWLVGQGDPKVVRRYQPHEQGAPPAGAEQLVAYFLHAEDAAQAVSAVNNHLASVSVDEVVTQGKLAVLSDLKRILRGVIANEHLALVERYMVRVAAGER